MSKSFSYLPHQDSLLKKYFGDIIVKKKLPRVIDLVHDVNLVLHNSHPIMQPAQVHAPNSIEIGGFQLKTEDDEIHPVRFFFRFFQINLSFFIQ